MCRYSDHDYRTHFVCLVDRHAAKYPRGTAPRCPTCAQPLLDLGRDFQAPRRNAFRQWEKLRLLVARGERFESCGCSGPGPRARTLGEARHPLLR